MFNQLRRVSFFRDFPEEDLEEISARLTYLEFRRDETIFTEGTPGDALYLLERGKVSVIAGLNTQRQTLATLVPGDIFGEMSVLTDEPRSASVVAATDCSVWALKKADFDRLLVDQPALAVTFARVLSRRLSQIDRQFSTAPRAEGGERLVAVIGDGAAPLARSLARQSAERILLLDLHQPLGVAQWSDWLEAVHPADGYDRLDAPREIAVDQLARMLGSLAESYDRILLQLPAHRTDLGLLAVSAAEAIIPLGPNARAAVESSWIKNAPGAHLWTLPPGANIDRLARRICRRTVGLALSSGSAHGLAHIGVLAILEEAHIPIDIIAGASIGSLIGGIYASGRGLPALLSFADEAAYRLSRRGGLWDYAIPFSHGLVWGDRVLRYIRKLVGNAAFEELPTALHVVAAELISGRERVLNTGPVADAVRASMSIPGLFVPFSYQGKYMVDGGAVNPVPCSVLAAAGANIILAVNVTAEPEDRVRRSVRVARWGRSGLPGVLEALLGSLELMEYHIAETRSRPVSVLIRPRTGLYDSMDAGKAPELIRAGEEAARAALGQVQALLAPKRRPASEG